MINTGKSMIVASMQGVSRNYPNGQGVYGLTFEIKQGQKVGLLGLNGSGKTTTIKLLAGLLRPDQGQVLVVGQKSPKSRSKIALMNDRAMFPSWMDPAAVKRFMHGVYPDFDINVFQDLCGKLDVPNQRRGSMSKGQAQRLSIAATFARRVELFILDEPLSGIDVVSREAILNLLDDYRQRDGALLISTHEIREVENNLDHILILRSGQLVLDESKSVLDQEGTTVIKRFIELNKDSK